MSNADRFHTDVVGDEYIAKQERLKKQAAAMEFKRNMASKREEDRWTAEQVRCCYIFIAF